MGFLKPGDEPGQVWMLTKDHGECPFPKARVDAYLSSLHPDHRAKVVERLTTIGVDLRASHPCGPSKLFAGERFKNLAPGVMADLRGQWAAMGYGKPKSEAAA